MAGAETMAGAPGSAFAKRVVVIQSPTVRMQARWLQWPRGLRPLDQGVRRIGSELADAAWTQNTFAFHCLTPSIEKRRLNGKEFKLPLLLKPYVSESVVIKSMCAALS